MPGVDGPTHRYIGASAGCWAIYADLLAGGMPAGALAGLAVDAYAVQHPGSPGPQSTQSVWVHLVALHLVLEGGWPASQAIRIRTVTADAFSDWPWLTPPASMGPLTIVDVAAAPEPGRVAVLENWVQGAWVAWSEHHEAVRDRSQAMAARRG